MVDSFLGQAEEGNKTALLKLKPLQVAVFEFGWRRLALRRCGDSSQQQPECEDGPFHMLLGFKHFLSV